MSDSTAARRALRATERTPTIDIPPGTSWAPTLPSGTTQRVKPSCAASRTRSAACEVGAHFAGQARPRRTRPRPAGWPDCADSTRRPRAPPRSAAGSATLIPPATFTNTSSVARFRPDALVEHGEQQREPARIEPVGRPPRVAERRRADERLHLDQHRPRALRSCSSTAEPGTFVGRSARNSFDGFGTARRPAPVISNTPSSLTAPKRFLTARTTRCA